MHGLHAVVMINLAFTVEEHTPHFKHTLHVYSYHALECVESIHVLFTEIRDINGKILPQQTREYIKLREFGMKLSTRHIILSIHGRRYQAPCIL